MTSQDDTTAIAADHLWAADILRVIRLGTKDWKVARRHGGVKKLRDATRMAERLYLEGKGWR